MSDFAEQRSLELAKGRLAVWNWLKREEVKAKIARQKRKLGDVYDCDERLFLLERAEKAEATARVLRKVLKLVGGA